MTPSLYSTKKNAVNTTNVPASGCNKIRIIGMRRISKANRTFLELSSLMLSELTYLESNRAVEILANSAG